MSAISVYIPTKNRLTLLSRAVASVQSQTFSDWECIIVDDGSSDGTWNYLQTLQAGDPRFRPLRNSVSAGACTARNQAVDHAQSDLITGLDDDDVFMPSRLETLVKAFSPSISMVSANDAIVGTSRGAFPTNRPQKSTLKHILRRNTVGNQALMRRDQFLQVGGFREGLKSSQDYELWIRMIDAHGPSICVPSVEQIVFAEPSRVRITNSYSKSRSASERIVLNEHRSKMGFVERCAHIGRIKAKDGDPSSMFFSLLSLDLSLDALQELKASIRTLGRANRTPQAKEGGN